jgi:hypothetical protein
MKNKSAPPVEVDRGVLTLLYDSISLGMMSQAAPDNESSTTLARASVVATTLYIEACANCCLDLLNLTTRFADEVDRLSTSAKLELFLQLKYKSRTLDRSRSEYQGYIELKRFRDAFVHPKAQQYQWTSWSEEESESASPQTNLLRLPLIPSYCGPEVVPTALKATHDFMSHFFRDLCRMSPGHVTGLLFSREPLPNPKRGNVPYWGRHIHSWLVTEGISLKYMRIGRF